MSDDPGAAKRRGSEGTLLQPVPLKEDGVGEISAERRIDTPDRIRDLQRGLYRKAKQEKAREAAEEPSAAPAPEAAKK